MFSTGFFGRFAFVPGLAALLMVTPAADAQNRGHLRVSVERAFGLSHNIVTSTVDAVPGVNFRESRTYHWTTFNLFGASFAPADPTGVGTLPMSQVPRIAVDYEFANRLTVGAAAFFSVSSVSTEGRRDVTTVGVGLAPRVGYSLPISDRLAFWPRAGVTASYVSTSGGLSGASVSYLPVWVNVEPTLVFAVDPRFQLTLGLVCDVPLIAPATTHLDAPRPDGADTMDNELEQLIIAAQLGVMGRF